MATQQTVVFTQVVSDSQWMDAEEENRQRAEFAADPTYTYVPFQAMNPAFIRERCLQLSSGLVDEINRNQVSLFRHSRILRDALGATISDEEQAAGTDGSRGNLCDSLDAFLAAKGLDYRIEQRGHLDDYAAEVGRNVPSISESIKLGLLLPALNSFIKTESQEMPSLETNTLPPLPPDLHKGQAHPDSISG